MENIIMLAGAAALFLVAGIAIGLVWAAARPATADRARALLRTGGVGEER